MKRLLVFLVLVLMLSGCSYTPDPVPSPQTTWNPPASLEIDLSEDAQSALSALGLCRDFVEDMNKRYPAYAPVLPATDAAYYDTRLRDPDADVDALSAELAQTIVALRQQVYLHMEETTKRHMPVPDGLEQFVREYEEQFHEIGW